MNGMLRHGNTANADLSQQTLSNNLVLPQPRALSFQQMRGKRIGYPGRQPDAGPGNRLAAARSWTMFTLTRTAGPMTPGAAATFPGALTDLLATFEPITLAQLEGAALLDRSELKYLLPRRLLLPVLAELRPAYRVLVVAEQPLSRYRTLYFDTSDLAMYRRHHAGAADRYKVRAREYMDSATAFLEVKHRTGTQRTVKRRIPTEAPVRMLPAQAEAFLAQTCPYPAEALTPALWNHYTRITLVSTQRAERVTLDFDVRFAHETAQVALPDIVIAEVKHAGDRQASEFVQLMRRHHVRETAFSKYCIGISFLYADVKHNRFKPKQRLLARLAHENSQIELA